MRFNKEIVKMVLFLALYAQTYDLLAQDIEENGGVPKHEEDSEMYKLYVIAKKYVEEYKEKGIYQSNNFNHIANKLNECVKDVEDATRGKEVMPMVFLVGVLRKYNFNRLHGFEDLKELDLEKAIRTSIQEGYFNNILVQTKSDIFRRKYWDMF